jgi:biopolymer transport protein ExbD
VIRRLVTPAPIAARINVTPIIDVALVLVIILLITAPMMTLAEMDLELPAARTQTFGDELRINVTLGRDGEVAIDERTVSAAVFGTALKGRLEDNPNVLVVVRADAGTPHRDVRALLKSARGAGAERLAIATRPADLEPR